jgi:hypothetical protein
VATKFSIQYLGLRGACFDCDGDAGNRLHALGEMSLTLVRASVYSCLQRADFSDCNIMLEAVPNRITNGSRRRRKYSAGALNSLLLLLIFYGATCGLVHSHSVSLQPVSTFGTTLDGAREADLTTRLLSTGKTCLLCQFHQQLSHGLFQTTPFALQPPANLVRLLALSSGNYSAPHASARGRAPPVASLL